MFSARHGMVRPVDDRYVAGVCSAIGRATRTDPILWRVILAVFTLFGGIGLVVYLIGWLLIPSEGDTASPLEAALGRGQSDASPSVVLMVFAAAAVTMIIALANDSKIGILGLAVIGAIAVWLARRGEPGGQPPGTMPPPPRYGPPMAPGYGPPMHPGAPGFNQQGFTPAAHVPPPGAPMSPPGSASTESASTGSPMSFGHGSTAVMPGGVPGVSAPPSPTKPGPFPPRPPLTPHGPFQTVPYQGQQYRTGAYQPGPTPFGQTGYPPPMPGYPAAPPPIRGRRPRQPKERSVLGRLTLSVLCLTLGVLGTIDLAGARFDGRVYVAGALAVVAAGLIVGAWMGRARGLIALGILLSLVLGVSATSVNYDASRARRVYMVTSVQEIQPNYAIDTGTLILDLTQTNFTSADVSVQLSANVGTVRVRLPQTVDVDITATIDVGRADVLNNHWSGVDGTRHTVHDVGSDGIGGGHLAINATIDAGRLEVTR